MDASLSKTRIDLENVVNNILVATGTFYKQGEPLFQEIMNICSTRLQLDECIEMMRNQNMKHIAANGINSAYGTLTGVLLFGKDKTIQKDNKRHEYTQKRRSKN